VSEPAAARTVCSLLNAYLPGWTADGQLLKHPAAPAIAVKTTRGDNVKLQSFPSILLKEAKLLIFCRVHAPEPPRREAERDQFTTGLLELRGFLARKFILKHYREGKYKTIPGYRVSLSRLKRIQDLLWWLQDEGFRHGGEQHPADAGEAPEAGLPGRGRGTVATADDEGGGRDGTAQEEADGLPA